MKTSIKPSPSFQPIDITLTIETPKELHLLSRILAANVRIPEMLVEDNSIEPEDEVAMTNLMSEIYSYELQSLFMKNLYIKG